jgi:hypothetical protein
VRPEDHPEKSARVRVGRAGTDGDLIATTADRGHRTAGDRGLIFAEARPPRATAARHPAGMARDHRVRTAVLADPTIADRARNAATFPVAAETIAPRREDALPSVVTAAISADRRTTGTCPRRSPAGM